MSWRYGLSILLGLAWCSLLSAGERLIPIQPGSIIRESLPTGNHPMVTKPGFQSFISQPDPTSGLLSLEREHRFALPRQALAGRTIRVLALRVEFQPDCDLSSSGTGLFDLRDTLQFLNEEGHEFDRAPHDRLFFERHLEALAQYYHCVSNGKLTLQTTVYPRELNSAYRMPYPMAYYGQNGPFNSWTESLGELVYDAVQLADTISPEIDFSEYDVVMIFHAGSDWQSDQSGLSNSPDDLPSANIFMAAPYIPVDSGTHSVRSVMLIPETTSQDGRVGVINGVLAHEFGHQLGFVDLYSTTDFRTVVGNFSLMDAGNLLSVDFGDQIVHGVLPCYPDAFHRAFAGFDTPIRLTEPATSIPVTATEIYGADHTIYQITINPHEYFLIENRQTNPEGETVALWLKDGVIAGPVNMEKTLLPAYDYLIPGSGMLIWHVDESIAKLDYISGDYNTNNWDANTLQLDPYHPFIAVEEADGSRDIGIFLNESGEAADMFSASTNQAFGTATNPNSASYSGIASGIEINSISESARTMNFDLSFSKLRPSYTHKQSNSAPYLFAYPFDSDQDEKEDLLMIDTTGGIYGFHQTEDLNFETFHEWMPSTFPDSSGLLIQVPLKYRPIKAAILSSQSEQLVFYNSSQIALMQPILPAGAFRLPTDGKRIETMTAMSDMALDDEPYNQGPGLAVKLRPDDSCFTIIYSVGNDAVRWRNVMGEYGSLELGYGRIVGLNYLTTPEPGTLIAVTEYGKILLITRLTSDNPQISQLATVGLCRPVGQPVAADIDRDGQSEIIFADQCGSIHAIRFDGTYPPNFPVTLSDETIQTSPVVYDIDRDGYPEILTASNQALHLINYNGTESANFPILFDRVNPPETPPSNPVLVKLDQNGDPSIWLGLTNGRLKLYSRFGNLETSSSDLRPDYYNRYDMSIDGQLLLSPIITDLNHDQQAEMILATDQGGLSIIPIDLAIDQAVWPMQGRNFEAWPNRDSLMGTTIPGETTSSIIKTSTVHNFPNPAVGSSTSIYYYLYQPARVTISLMDFSGHRITTLEGSSYPMTENIVPLNLSGLQPDIYLCLVEAEYQGKREKALFKLAIIR